MAADFPLPDTMDILSYPGLELLIAGVPCRQVPQFMQPEFSFSAGTGNPIYTITHHVDFDDNPAVVDATERDAGSRYIPTPGCALLVYLGAVELLLLPVWVEDRYTNTERFYQRAYCWREYRHFP